MGVHPLRCECGSILIPHRYVLSFMSFLAIVCCYNMRLALFLAITEIAVTHNTTNQNSEGICPIDPDDNEHTIPPIEGGKYNWTEKQQGIILLSFFPGYLITHLPGGMLADKLGGRWVLLTTVTMSAVFSFLTPVAIQELGWIALIVVRFALGLSQGPLFPATASLLANWVPLRERSVLGGLVYSGVQLGSVIGNLFSGLLIQYFNNWPVVFYVWGIVGCIWGLIFYLFCYSRPDSHPNVTQEEKELLELEIGPVKHFKVPWKHILKDCPLLALTIIQIGHDWILYIFVVDLPKFFKSVLHFNVGKNGVITATAYMIMWVSSMVCGWIGDFIINHNLMTVIHLRKLYGAISGAGPAMCSLAATYVGCNQYHVVALLWLGMVFNGPWFPGPKVNNLDLSLNFSGIIMSITNGMGVLSGIIAPYAVAIVVQDGTLKQWQSVFWLTLVIVLITHAIFVVFGSGARREWDLNPTDT